MNDISLNNRPAIHEAESLSSTVVKDGALEDGQASSVQSAPLTDSQDDGDGLRYLYNIYLERTRRYRSMRFYLGLKRWLTGPDPPQILRIRSFPIEQSFERHLSRLTRGCRRWRWIVLPIFLVLWLIAVALLVNESWYSSSTSAGAASVISNQASFWAQNDQCGMTSI